jgi:hypothetical protein
VEAGPKSDGHSEAIATLVEFLNCFFMGIAAGKLASPRCQLGKLESGGPGCPSRAVAMMQGLQLPTFPELLEDP